MSDTDPLLRAIATGDPAAPDGQALAELGKLVRKAGALPRPVALSDTIQAQLFAAHDGDTSVDGQVDHWVEDRAHADPELARLGDLIAKAGTLPDPVDLTGRVRLQLGPARHVRDPERANNLRRTIRIVAAVIAGHLVAAFLFGMIQLDLDDHPTHAEWSTAERDVASPSPLPARPNTASSLLPMQLPQAWTNLRDLDIDLFMTRQNPELREELRRASGCEATATLVGEGLEWLISRQQADTGAIGHLSGDLDRDQLTQAWAALALLGEGTERRTRRMATARVVHWLVAACQQRDPSKSYEALGPTLLALSEGALLLPDADGSIRATAEALFVALDNSQLPVPGQDGMGGLVLLALEIAQQGRLHVPGRLLQHARRSLARSLPDQNAAVGRIGLAAFSRFIFGLRTSDSTAHLVDQLAQSTEKPAIPSLLFPSLALREAGGTAWKTWTTSLVAQHATWFEGTDGTRHVPADRIPSPEHHGDATVSATAMALCVLQTPYRYLPVAR